MLFVNLRHNSHLDADVAPIGSVVSGMEVVDEVGWKANLLAVSRRFAY